MSIRAKCPGCGKVVKAGDDWAGRSGKCPGCGAEIRFLNAAAAAPTSQQSIGPPQLPPPPPAPPPPTTGQASPDDKERVIWTGHPSQITNLATFIIGTLLCWLVLPILIAVWRWLKVRCVTYELTNERLRIAQGVLSRRVDELELYRVKDTALAQPLGLRLFSLATVQITASDTSNPKTAIVAIPVDEANAIREMIRSNVERLRSLKRVREIDLA